MLTTKKVPPILHKNLQVPRSPQHHQNGEKKQSKSNREKDNQGKNHKASRQKVLKPISGNRIKGQLSPPLLSRNITLKSKSLKKSKSEQTERSRNKKDKNNLYTKTQHKEYNFLQNLSEKSFKKVGQFKLELLAYIFRKRLVRDEQYNDLYAHLVQRFPKHEEVIKQALFEIVSTLDS